MGVENDFCFHLFLHIILASGNFVCQLKSSIYLVLGLCSFMGFLALAISSMRMPKLYTLKLSDALPKTSYSRGSELNVPFTYSSTYMGGTIWDLFYVTETSYIASSKMLTSL